MDGTHSTERHSCYQSYAMIQCVSFHRGIRPCHLEKTSFTQLLPSATLWDRQRGVGGRPLSGIGTGVWASDLSLKSFLVVVCASLRISVEQCKCSTTLTENGTNKMATVLNRDQSILIKVSVRCKHNISVSIKLLIVRVGPGVMSRLGANLEGF